MLQIVPVEGADATIASVKEESSVDVLVKPKTVQKVDNEKRLSEREKNKKERETMRKEKEKKKQLKHKLKTEQLIQVSVIYNRKCFGFKLNNFSSL